MIFQQYVIQYPPKLASTRPYEQYGTLRKHELGEVLTNEAVVVKIAVTKAEALEVARQLNVIHEVMGS